MGGGGWPQTGTVPTVILVDAQDIAVSRPGKPLFTGLSLTVSSGDRLAVVGTVGFESYKTNPDYKAYVQRLQAVERTARAENKKIRKFDPTAFQWVGN